MNNDLKFKDYIIRGIVAIGTFLGMFLIIFFISGTALIVLGMKYDSILSVAKFFALYMILSLPIEILLIGKLFTNIKRLTYVTKVQNNILHFIVEVPIQISLLCVSSSIIEGIILSIETIIIFSILDFCVSKFLSIRLEQDKANEEGIRRVSEKHDDKF